MDKLELLQQIFEVCIVPLLGVLTTFIVKWLQKKADEIQVKIDNETLNKYIDMLTETITNCVIATNQTYVDVLKKEGKFDAAAQQEAFNKTRDAVYALLTTEAKDYLIEAYGDLTTYINQLIEAKVNEYKLEVKEELTCKKVK